MTDRKERLTPKAGDWIKLRGANDWGSSYLSVNPLNIVGCAELRRAYRLTEGEALTVRLPNGTQRTGVVVSTKRNVRVSDMGHEYDAATQDLSVRFDDYTHIALGDVEVQYEPERDPTREGGEVAK